MGTVDDYLSGLAESDRAAVAELYLIAQDAVPEAEQGIGYGMAALTYRGAGLWSAVRAKKHIGVYPFSAGVIAALAHRLDGVEHAKGSLKLTPGAPVPVDVLRELVLARKAEIDARNTK